MNLLQIIPEQIWFELKDQKAYLVGGAVRDFLLGKTDLKDFDFVIFDCPSISQLASALADKTSSSYVLLDSQTDSHRVVNKNWQLDIVAPRAESLLLDLAARDISLNAIAYDPAQNQIIDPLNGQSDLEAGLIRAISADNLKADPLRMLRVYRMAAQVGQSKKITIDSQTAAWVKEHAKLIQQIAPERISIELWSLLAQPDSFKYLNDIWQSGLWEAIFPEFTELRKVPSNDFHHLPLPEHTFELVRQYEEFVLPKLPEVCRNYIAKNVLGSITLVAVLKMGCLLHDIAKPATWQIKETKHTFYGHDKLGAEISETIGKRMCWPNAVIRCLKDLVNFHLRPFNIAALDTEPSEKAERKFFRQIGNSFYPLIALAWADLLSIRGPRVTDTMVEMSEKRLLVLIERYNQHLEQEQTQPLLLTGERLVEAIEVSQLPPTKIIKELLNQLRELQFSGQVLTEQQAYDWFISEGKARILLAS
jgi:putative nucleotidyltransferase with HDIG domain